MKNKTQDNVSGQEANDLAAEVDSGGVLIAELVGLSSEGRPLITWPNNPGQTQEAMSTIPVNGSSIGRQVAVLFNNGSSTLPIIIGIIQNPLLDMLETHAENSTVGDENKGEANIEMELDNLQSELLVDGKKLVIEATDEIVLKCGASSITLTRSGKIIIRGKYLLNRSSGVNRIMGGSVQIN